MTALGTPDVVEPEPADEHAQAARVHVHVRNEELVLNLEQEEGAVFLNIH